MQRQTLKSFILTLISTYDLTSKLETVVDEIYNAAIEAGYNCSNFFVQDIVDSYIFTCEE